MCFEWGMGGGMDECKTVSATLCCLTKRRCIVISFFIGNWIVLELGSHVGCFPYKEDN